MSLLRQSDLLEPTHSEMKFFTYGAKETPRR